MTTAHDSFAVLRPTGRAAPLVVHVPHASRVIPPAVRADFRCPPEELDEELALITDELTDALFAPALDLGATLFVNRLSRLVVDPERFRDDDAEGRMAGLGMGAVRTRLYSGRPLRRPGFSPADRAALLECYFDPYAAALADLVDDTLRAHGRCLIVDAHSFTPHPVRLGTGARPLPDICLGWVPAHAPDSLLPRWRAQIEARGLTWADNHPFAGSYVPMRHWQSEPRVRSVMVEVNKRVYLEEATPVRMRTDGATVIRELLSAAALWLRG